MKQTTSGLKNTHLSDVQIYLKEHAKDWAIQYVRDAIREQEKLININVSRHMVNSLRITYDMPLKTAICTSYATTVPPAILRESSDLTKD